MTCPVGSFRCMDCDGVARKADQMHWVETPDEDAARIAVCPHCNARRENNREGWQRALLATEELLCDALTRGGDPMAQDRRNMIWVAAGAYTIGFEQYEKAAGTGFFYSPAELEAFGEDGPPPPSPEFEAAIEAAIASERKH